MRPPCHKCKKPADIIENKIFWCAKCKCIDLSLEIGQNIPPQTTGGKYAKEEENRDRRRYH